MKRRWETNLFTKSYEKQNIDQRKNVPNRLIESNEHPEVSKQNY